MKAAAGNRESSFFIYPPCDRSCYRLTWDRFLQAKIVRILLSDLWEHTKGNTKKHDPWKEENKQYIDKLDAIYTEGLDIYCNRPRGYTIDRCATLFFPNMNWTELQYAYAGEERVDPSKALELRRKYFYYDSMLF